MNNIDKKSVLKRERIFVFLQHISAMVKMLSKNKYPCNA